LLVSRFAYVPVSFTKYFGENAQVKPGPAPNSFDSAWLDYRVACVGVPPSRATHGNLGFPF
jgi:hypothetical protein